MNFLSIAKNKEFYKNKKILVTGHTGFKGSWLVCILNYLGCNSVGYALPAPDGGLYNRINGDSLIKSYIGDLNEYNKLIKVFDDFSPEIVIHLAAFGFVNECFNDPVRSYETNLMGTVHLLEAVRHCNSVKSVVLISTDKVYDNKGDGASYAETDALGGIGPYSSSKTCVEILANDYRKTYFENDSHYVGIATARASNVLGGGDHIQSRLIPSILKAVYEGKSVELRNPNQTRPWQSVFDALNGYLSIARLLYENPEKYSGAWNIGPRQSGVKSVKWVLDTIKNYFGEIEQSTRDVNSFIKESETLGLNINKSLNNLDWEPVLSVVQTIELVSEFYKRQMSGESEFTICMDQITDFFGR